MSLCFQLSLWLLSHSLKGLVLQQEKESDFLLMELPGLCLMLELCLLEK